MITVRTIQGRHTPLVTCDVCGERIQDPAMSVVSFVLAGDPDQPPRFAHKGACHDALDAEIKADGGFPGWNEFGRWMADLAYNAGLRGEAWERATESSDLMAELGL